MLRLLSTLVNLVKGCLYLEMAVPPPSNGRLSNNVKKQRNVWKYELSSNQGRYQVCCAFFLSVLDIKHKSLHVIQDKFEHGVFHFVENRGKHNNRPWALSG